MLWWKHHVVPRYARSVKHADEMSPPQRIAIRSVGLEQNVVAMSVHQFPPDEINSLDDLSSP